MSCMSLVFAVAGLPPDKVIEAHGTFSTASCVRCHVPQDAAAVKDAIFSDKVPRCCRYSGSQ